jgi:hypothetical protein
MNELIIKKIYSTNQQTVISAIDELGQSGNSSYLPMLIDLLHSTLDNEVGERIITLLCELKHPDAAKYLVDAINDPKYLTIRETLTRTCWENGLDYTAYFGTFIRLLINSDYMTAFEAFTVIENSEEKIANEQVQEYLHQMRSALQTASDDRKILLHRIIQFLPSLIKSEPGEN